MKNIHYLLIIGILCILLECVILLGFYLSNITIMKQEFHADTLYVKDVSRNCVYPNVFQTSLQRINPLKEKQDLSSARVEKALKKGMETLKDGLIEQGFTQEMVAYYVGRWNTSFNLQFATLKARAKKEGQTIEEWLDIKLEEVPELEQLRAIVLSGAINYDPEDFIQGSTMFVFVILIGFQNL